MIIWLAVVCTKRTSTLYRPLKTRLIFSICLQLHNSVCAPKLFTMFLLEDRHKKCILPHIALLSGIVNITFIMTWCVFDIIQGYVLNLRFLRQRVSESTTACNSSLEFSVNETYRSLRQAVFNGLSSAFALSCSVNICRDVSFPTAN